MRTERRRRRRVHLQLPVTIDGGQGMPPHDCIILKISDSGARLDIVATASIPDEFIMLLSPRAYPRRLCKVIWRQGDQVGVAFDQPSISDRRARS